MMLGVKVRKFKGFRHKKRRPGASSFISLVEVAGFEPASANPLPSDLHA